MLLSRILKDPESKGRLWQEVRRQYLRGARHLTGERSIHLHSNIGPWPVLLEPGRRRRSPARTPGALPGAGCDQCRFIANDLTGRMLLRNVRDAAKRGVHVRLPVDDLYTSRADSLVILRDEPDTSFLLNLR